MAQMGQAEQFGIGDCTIDNVAASCGSAYQLVSAGAAQVVPIGFGSWEDNGNGGLVMGRITDDGISYNFSNPEEIAEGFNQYKGVLTNAALAEMLGLPDNFDFSSQLPRGAPQWQIQALADGMGVAIHQLKKDSCSNFYGGQGLSTITSTHYSFQPLGSEEIARTVSSSSVFINSNGSYMTSAQGSPEGLTFGVPTRSMFRGITLLHELGHQLSDVTGFKKDNNNPNLNLHQTKMVKQQCF